MIRWRNISTIEYGHFAEALQICHELNEIARARGWREGRVLVPTAGVDNQLVIEVEYPDFAAYQAEGGAMMSDAEFMKQIRAMAEITYPQSSHSELLEDAPATIA